MKKYILLLSLSAAFFACNNASTDTTSTETKPKEKSAAMDNPDYDKGLNLVAKSDCFTCHKLREQSTGPSYGDVANKYPNTPENVTMLADKIITGGKGNWGTVPMTAHAALPKEDAVAMVKYIMLLKETK